MTKVLLLPSIRRQADPLTASDSLKKDRKNSATHYCPKGNPSGYQRRPTLLNFNDPLGTAAFNISLLAATELISNWTHFNRPCTAKVMVASSPGLRPLSTELHFGHLALETG